MFINEQELYEKIINGFKHYEENKEFWDDIFLKIFHLHIKTHEYYRKWVVGLGIDPDHVDKVEKIPPVPIQLFKTVWPGRYPREKSVRIFHSSGTTRGREKRSTHPFFRLELYHENAMAHFRRMVLPDREKIPMLIIAPTDTMVPDSSLGFMLRILVEAFGAGDSLIAWTAEGLDTMSAIEWLIWHRDGEPCLVFGTALGLYRFMKEAREKGIEQFKLPEKSRVLETGGFKGVRMELNREDFRRELQRFFGDGTVVMAEYGMCELGSQLYENTFLQLIQRDNRPVRLVPPPWLRVFIWDPVRWRPVKASGHSGPIAFFDVANLDSFPFFVSEDRGRVDEFGLVLEGRLRGAELRGCSLLAEPSL